MKKSFLIKALTVLCYVSACTVNINSQTLSFDRVSVSDDGLMLLKPFDKINTSRVMKYSSISRSDNSEEIKYLAGDVKFYLFSENDWVLKESYKQKYDGEGRIYDVLKQTFMGYKSSIHNTYTYYDDSREMIEERLDNDGMWVKSIKDVAFYDEIVKDFVYLQETHLWDDQENKWCDECNGPYGFYNEIVRDSVNRVISSKTWDNVNKDMAFLGFEMGYDGDGAAIDMYLLTESRFHGKFTKSFYYGDIKWHKTNCQYIRQSNNVYFSLLNDPDNLAESYKIYACNKYQEPEGEPILCNAEYDDMDRIVKTSLSVNDGDTRVVSENTYEYFGDTNQYTLIYLKKWNDVNGNNVFDDSDNILYEEKTEKEYDENGNIVSDLTYKKNADGEFEIAAGGKFEYVLDEKGLISQVKALKFIDGDFLPYSKLVYSEYVGIDTAVENVTNTEFNIEGNVLKISGMEGKCFFVSDLQGIKCMSGIVRNSAINLNSIDKGIYVIKIDDRINLKFLKS